jgi:hypothetical protein
MSEAPFFFDLGRAVEPCVGYHYGSINARLRPTPRLPVPRPPRELDEPLCAAAIAPGPHPVSVDSPRISSMTRFLLRVAVCVGCACVAPIEAEASGAAALATGGGHTCALTATGGVVCWGTNASGQLGDGTTTQRSTPTAVGGLETGVLTIAAGNSHTCALTAAGGVLCWGSNGNGELGDGTTAARSTPAAVRGLETGVNRSNPVPPSPTWPLELLPQHFTPPPVVSAHV